MNKTWAAATLLAVMATATPSLAATARDCDGTTEAAFNIVEPWETSTRTFYQGRVRVAWLDTGGEPACCSAHLLVVFYADDMPESLVCRLVGDTADRGFASIDFKSLKSAYDPARGLLLTFGYSAYPRDGDFDVGAARGLARVRINVPSGAVTVE